MLPEAVRRLAASLRGDSGRAAIVAALLAVCWLVVLRQPEGGAAPATPSVGFQPVPNTSPVPTDFLLKQAALPKPSTGSSEGSASRTEFILFQSQALGRPMHYLAYQPPGYAGGDQRYSTLYMLHGIGGGFGGTVGNETEWPGYGLLTAADNLIAGGAIRPLLIIMPEGDQSYWMDAANGGPKYGTYLVDDVVRDVDSRFRTVPDRDHRGIGGLSMGGFGSLASAVLRPQVFGIAGAHSPSLAQLDKAPSFFGEAEYFAQHDPVQLLHGRAASARSLQLWLDVADQDPQWAARAEALHEQLLADGIAHQWHQWPGQHNGVYWGEHMADYLKFYDGALA
ncbi:MAG TPA: alpha/beta hydrolase-fold protein [Chloroflexota bacterium]